MKESPILMSAPMVRATLREVDPKTQTRRVMSERHRWHFIEASGDFALCPYGQPGDLLWVREAWRTTSELDKFSGRKIAEKCIEAGYVSPWAPLHYEADGSRRNWQHTGMPPHGESEPPAGRYRHARFMPRWASRITLEITGVRVQRLQEISESDAYDEGIDTLSEAYLAAEHASIGGAPGPAPAVCAYASLWDNINGPGSWEANPWVWAISFKRLTR